MGSKKITLKEKWYWFNASWCVEDEADHGIHNTAAWYSWPDRILRFVWDEWISVKICKRFSHKWEEVEDHSFSVCTRCGVDTEISGYY